MGPIALALPVLLIFLLASAFLLGRYLNRARTWRHELSAVSRQHLELFQGGHLNEIAVECTKRRIREQLERGDVASVEAGLRPGTGYVIQVRALAELGTETAGRILERQLQRRLTDDVIEQSWYWIDLAHGLRLLNDAGSLPSLLRCAEEACDSPLGHLYAAETVCVLGFSGYLREGKDSALGCLALRALHRALEGLRWWLPPQVVTEARLGEQIETLWDHHEGEWDPLTVRVFRESLRLLRRSPFNEQLLAGDAPELEAYRWQMSRLSALEPMIHEHLAVAPKRLREALLVAAPAQQPDLIRGLIDLRAEAGETVLALLADPTFRYGEMAVELLRWSRHPHAGKWLREQAMQQVPLHKRSQRRPKPFAPRRPSLPPDCLYRAILHSLRGHGSGATEALLLLAARDWDPTYRAAAVGSLGWWEPLRRVELLATLQEARRDSNPEVRQAARAALARLGERQALQWYRQTLVSEDPHRAHETIQLIAQEGLTLLWPDLDRLADAEDTDIAHHARESLTRLSEEMEEMSPTF